MVCSGEQCWGPGVSMVTLPMPCVGVSLLAGCQWALLELQVKEQSLSGHTLLGRVTLGGRRPCTCFLGVDAAEMNCSPNGQIE